MDRHHYLKYDYHNNFIHNCYENFILNGGIKITNGDEKQKYDFILSNNRLFVGHPIHACIDIEILNEEVKIIWFGHSKNCIHWKNSKHMFLWSLIILFKNYPNITKISLGDDTRINCGKQYFPLSKYYFLKYGKLYYELYFNFQIYFFPIRKEKEYKNALTKREILKITKEWVNNFLLEIHENKPEFLDLFNEKSELPISTYLSLFNKSIKEKYCNIFYIMINTYYDDFINIYLPTDFYYNIKNKDSLITYLRNKINNL